MTSSLQPAYMLRLLGVLFVIAVLVNYIWELAQSFLFVGMTTWSNIWWHCFVASLGDGLILWIIFASGWAFLSRPDWFIDPGFKGYVVMLSSGFLIAIAIEWYAVHVLARWEYTDQMPTLPGTEVGITPILQMLILPPLIFRITAALVGRADE